MIDCITGGGVEEKEEEESDHHQGREMMESKNNNNNIRLSEVLVPQGSMDSMLRKMHNNDSHRHVVIVMDALRGFSLEPLQWALHHLITTHHYSTMTITLLGVMPWIPLALSCKTWLDVWTYDVEDLSTLKPKATTYSYSNKTHNNKHHKIREVIQLCHQKGVVPCIKVAMGHPLRLVVLEQTTNLHASFVVLDRHLRKNKAFFQERLPSSVVMLKSDGEVDMLRVQPPIDSCDTTPQQSPVTLISTPEVILSHALYSQLHTNINN